MPNVHVLYVLSALILATCFLILQFAVYLMSPEAEFDIDNQNIIAYLVGIGGLLLIFSVFSFNLSKRIKRLLLETEFLNLLFASGMRLDTDFCMVLHHSGKAVYYDRNFVDIYGIERGQDAFAVMLEKAGLNDDAKLKIQRAVEDKQTITVDIPKYSLQIKPLERPKGFSVLKAVKR
jgi:hypothetical protein